MIADLKYAISCLRNRNHIRRVLYHWGRSTTERRSTTDVTLVVVGRNDDYMPNFGGRLLATVEWNLRHGVREVVFVEWNPPADRPLLSYSLAQRFENVRCYVVPNKLHQEACQNDRLPLMEYHAKNAGIRRSNSRFVVAANADIFLGFDTLRTIRNLTGDENAVWTARRIDVDWNDSKSAQKIGLRHCLSYRRALGPHGTGDFLLAPRRIWEQARGYDEALLKHRVGCDIRGMRHLMALGARRKFAGTVFHMAHPTSVTEGSGAHQGIPATLEGVPYSNPEDWGLWNREEVKLADRVWELR